MIRVDENTMELSKEDVDACFNGASNQWEALVRLYKLVYPECGLIAELNSYPSVGPELSNYIYHKFIQFDIEKHSKREPGTLNILPGGLWMNRGFSEDRSIGPWTIIRCGFTTKLEGGT